MAIRWRGVYSGNSAGVPATGQSIEPRGISVFNVKVGRVLEQRAVPVMLGVLRHTGAIPRTYCFCSTCR